MNRVENKTCIVTGATLGIGNARAQRLADEGANLALFDVLDEAGQAFAGELQARGVKASRRSWIGRFQPGQ